MDNIKYYAFVIFTLKGFKREIKIEYYTIDDNVTTLDKEIKAIENGISRPEDHIEVVPYPISRYVYDHESFEYIPKVFLIGNKILSVDDLLIVNKLKPNHVPWVSEDNLAKSLEEDHSKGEIYRPQAIDLDNISPSAMKIIAEAYDKMKPEEDDEEKPKSSGIITDQSGDVITLPYYPNDNDILLCKRGTYV